jgi:hypothetical protein
MKSIFQLSESLKAGLAINKLTTIEVLTHLKNEPSIGFPAETPIEKTSIGMLTVNGKRVIKGEFDRVDETLILTT